MAHPYEAFLHRVQKPARYLGGEFGSIRKDWDSVPIRTALAFPDAYEIGMSHLGLRILYGILNAERDILAERVFAPWGDLEAELRARRIPLVSVEGARPLSEFDCVGFSLQYELTFTNLLAMLDLGGIPLRWEDRTLAHPLVVAGGPAAAQPEPLAPFIDCFLVGDGEEAFPALLREYVRLRGAGLGRTEVLEGLAALGGVYCPALYDVAPEPRTGRTVIAGPRSPGVPARVARRIIPDLDRHPFPAAPPVPSTEAVFDRISLEIARGCTEGCRFCQAGTLYRPVRERSPDRIVETILESVRRTGYDEASLTSLSTADYGCLSPLVKGLMARLREEKVALSVSSLRAYGLPEDLLEAISEVRNTSLTFAPEAGTQRMRDVISKNISEEDMDRSAHGAFSRGWRKVKLYFMIGLPTETEEDVRGIVAAADRYLEIADRYHRRGTAEVTASISSFVPKPHTPFQWAEMLDMAGIERKQKLLMDLTRGKRVRLKWHDPRISYIEAIVARGDRRVADAIEGAFRAGCRFDGWGEQLRFEEWEAAFRAAGVEAAEYLRGHPVGARLPWDHIDVGVTAEFLEREWRKAHENEPSPPCMKPRGGWTAEADASPAPRLVCLACGADCDLGKIVDDRRRALARVAAIPAPERPPAEPVESAPPAAPAPSLDEIQARNDRPRNRLENARKVRYRLRYTKLGPQRFISHLDLIRVLPRVFRRAGIDVAYSRGFHPKPILAFSPALPLGWGSRAEYLDVVLAEEIGAEELLGRLGPASPEGIDFTAAALLGDGDPPLGRVIDTATYEVLLPAGTDLEALRRKLGTIGRGPPIVATRKREGRAVEFDVTASILSASVAEAAPAPVLELRLALDGACARPGDLLAWATGAPGVPQDVCRTGLGKVRKGAPDADPLDLAAHRFR